MGQTELEPSHLLPRSDTKNYVAYLRRGADIDVTSHYKESCGCIQNQLLDPQPTNLLRKGSKNVGCAMSSEIYDTL